MIILLHNIDGNRFLESKPLKKEIPSALSRVPFLSLTVPSARHFPKIRARPGINENLDCYYTLPDALVFKMPASF